MTKVFEAVASGDTLELRIYGRIGGGLFSDGVSAKSISDALNSAPNAKSILIRMSSPGGAAFEGNAIRSILAAHPAKVTCEIEGLAASAASVIAMGADKIRMHEGSAMMIHEASTYTEGDAKEHQRAIDALTTLNDGMASIYAARSGMDKQQCLDMMAAETWLTPAQAVEKKLADEVLTGKQPSAAAPMAFDLKPFGYRNAPEKFTAAATSAPQMETTQMTIARIATALGLDSSSDEAAVMASLGKLQSRATAAEQPLAELRALTATADNVSLLGAVRGIVETAKQVPELKAQLEAAAAEAAKQADAIEEQKRASIIAADKADPKGRKLTPALEAFWTEKDENGKSKYPLAMFEAFMAKAQHQVVVQTAVAQPKVKASPTPAAAVGGGSNEPLTHEGKAWEELTFAALADLKASSPELYEALQANWKERGSPRRKSQRASA